VADRLGHIVDRVAGAFCVAAFAGMLGTALLGVFFRYIMTRPFQWTEELARYLLIWMGFAAISLGVRRREHIVVFPLAEKLPPRFGRWVDLLVDLLVIFFFVYLLREGFHMTSRTMLRASTLPISMVWIHLAVPVAALLALVQLAANLVRKLSGESVPRPGQEA
jgi:TRAP-type C4-dicarboxylate transport system permease small subunit